MTPVKPRAAARHAKLVRTLRRFLRVLVACFALVAVLGGSVAPAAAALARTLSAPACHCPHGDDEEKKSCPCCHDHEGDAGCLPANGSGCGAPLALAPPAHGDLVPLPMLAGEVTSLDVAPLRDRLTQLRLDRPPRV